MIDAPIRGDATHIVWDEEGAAYGQTERPRILELGLMIPTLAITEAQEVDMLFARRFSMHLKPNSVAEFTEKEEKEIIPVIRKLKGFRDLIAFVSPSGTDAFVITFWDGAESAEAYGRETYPRLVKVLANVTDGTPVVETYRVSNSTLHKTAAA